MKLAVAYERKSTDMQEYSIDDQDRIITEYADRNDYKIIRRYKDEGISGRNAEKRPAFMQMIEDSEFGDFDTVLIYDSSRFARNLEQSLIYKSILKRNNVTLISVTEPTTADEDTSLLTDALLGAMNEMYVRKLSKNVKRGVESKLLRGEWFGNPPHGYIKVNKALVIEPKEAEIIRYIFDAVLSGETYYSIFKHLHSAGIKTRRGLDFCTRSIYSILTNQAYRGYLETTVDGVTRLIKAKHDPIIDEETFSKVQQIVIDRKIKHNYKQKPRETGRHWLSGLIRCANCNSIFVYVDKASRSPRFRCSGYGQSICHVPTVMVSVVEDMVLNTLDQIQFCDSNYLYSLNIRVPAPTSMIDYDAKIRQLNLKLTRAKQAYLAEIDTLDEYRDNKNRISAEIAEIEAAKKKSETPKVDPEAFRAKALDAVEVIKSDKTGLEEKKAASRGLFEKIVFDSATRDMQLYFFA